MAEEKKKQGSVFRDIIRTFGDRISFSKKEIREKKEDTVTFRLTTTQAGLVAKAYESPHIRKMYPKRSDFYRVIFGQGLGLTIAYLEENEGLFQNDELLILEELEEMEKKTTFLSHISALKAKYEEMIGLGINTEEQMVTAIERSLKTAPDKQTRNAAIRQLRLPSHWGFEEEK